MNTRLKHEALFDAPTSPAAVAACSALGGAQITRGRERNLRKPMPILGFLGRSKQETQETQELSKFDQPTQEPQESYKAKIAFFPPNLEKENA